MIFPALLNSRQTCLRTSTLVTYLYGIQCSFRTELTGKKENNLEYRRFVISKTLDYLIPLQGTIRFLYITFRLDEKNAQSLADHLPYNPIIITGLQQSTFLNFTVLRCISLLPIFSIVLDHSVYFGMGYPFISLVWQLMIANGQHFWALNERRFFGKGRTRKSSVDSDVDEEEEEDEKERRGNTWQRRLSFCSPSPYRQLWNTFSAQFSRTSLDCFPTLSSRLRAQMVLYSAGSDVTIACLNFIMCKCLYFFIKTKQNFLNLIHFIYFLQSS